MVEIVYLDFPSADTPHNQSWNYSALRGRFLLNFKQLPYTTKWLEFPELKPYLKAKGVAPNAEGREYTIPTIKYGNEYIVDSMAIARRLEKDFPEHPLHLDAPEAAEVSGLFFHTLGPLFIVVMDAVINKLTNPVSSKYCWDDVKEERGGVPIEELKKNPQLYGDAPFEAAKESFKKWEEIVQRKGGPFVLGKEASFADIFIMSILALLRRTGEDIYQRVIADKPALDRLYEASRPWSDKQD